MTDQPTRQDTAQDAPPERRIYAGEAQWRVFEHTPGYDRRAKPTLVFESYEIMRRVREFPPNWRELSDAELLAVSEGR